jgi:hypothetical protein
MRAAKSSGLRTNRRMSHLGTLTFESELVASCKEQHIGFELVMNAYERHKREVE